MMNRLTCLYVVLGKHMVLSNKKKKSAKPLLQFLPQRVERAQAVKHRKCKTQHNTDRMTSGWYY